MQLQQQDIAQIIALARQVGTLIMEDYHQPHCHQIERKADASVVTQADRRAGHAIEQGLKSIFPYISVIQEEADEAESLDLLQQHELLWIVDPIDGTNSFIKQHGDFTVNIALLTQGNPTFGLIYQPASDTLYYTDHANRACKISRNSTFEHITVKQVVDWERGLMVVSSHRPVMDWMQAFYDQLPLATRNNISSSIKFCLLAEGSFDIYANFSPMKLWDVAAGQAIIEAAGGIILDATSGVPLYHPRNTLCNVPFVAFTNHIEPAYIQAKLKAASTYA